MRTPQDLAAFIADNRIEAELITDIGETPTVAAAAIALGVNEDDIIKTLLFYVSGQPYAVITNGTATVPARPLADHFGVGKRQVKLARAEQVVEVTGYPAGGVPPFGHVQLVLVLLDSSLMAKDVIFGGGGDDRTMLRIAVSELVRLTTPTILKLT
ncbi:MAG: hypothetical protein J5I90_15265 [Caldilineales bacterium]|nr:hypothetical protein [Caldilineales bacterium]